MGTTNPKLQGYVEQEVFEAFNEWKEQNEVAGNSAALNQLLRKALGLDQSQEPAAEYAEYMKADLAESPLAQLVNQLIDKKLPTREEIRIEIQEELWDSGKRDFIEGIRIEAKETISRAVSQEKEFWRALGDNHDEVKRAIAQLGQRIEKLEGNLSDEESLKKKVARMVANILVVELPTSLKSRLEALENHRLPQSVAQLPETAFSSNGVVAFSGAELARRLKVDSATLVKNRSKTNFEEWTRAKDPEAIAWRYAADLKAYEPSPNVRS